MDERSTCSSYAFGDHLGRCNNVRVSLQLAAKPKATRISDDNKTRRKRRSGTSSAAKATISTTNTKQSAEQQTNSSRRKSPVATPRRKRVGRPSTKADSWYQRTEMLDHRVLSREEELELGRQIAAATALRDKLTDLADNRRVERELYGDRRRQVAGGMADMGDYDKWDLPQEDANVQFLPSDEELFQLGMGSSFSLVQGDERSQNSDDDDNNMIMSEDGGFTIMDQDTGEIAEVDGMGYMYNNRNRDADDDIPIALQEGSKFAVGRVERDLAELSNEEVIEILGVGGGKAEARTTLRVGAEARRELMKCNIRLVVSIAKKWIKGNPTQMANGSGNLRELYEGGWDRPSLDEVIQEGILGLSRAIDKYDYEKGLKFSTYSTWWIQNYVRISFQTAKTGPLKLPAQFHLLKNRYLKAIAKLTREGRPIPPWRTLRRSSGRRSRGYVMPCRRRKAYFPLTNQWMVSPNCVEVAPARSESATTTFALAILWCATNPDQKNLSNSPSSGKAWRMPWPPSCLRTNETASASASVWTMAKPARPTRWPPSAAT